MFKVKKVANIGAHCHLCSGPHPYRGLEIGTWAVYVFIPSIGSFWICIACMRKEARQVLRQISGQLFLEE